MAMSTDPIPARRRGHGGCAAQARGYGLRHGRSDRGLRRRAPAAGRVRRAHAELRRGGRRGARRGSRDGSRAPRAHPRRGPRARRRGAAEGRPPARTRPGPLVRARAVHALRGQLGPRRGLRGAARPRAAPGRGRARRLPVLRLAVDRRRLRGRLRVRAAHHALAERDVDRAGAGRHPEPRLQRGGAALLTGFLSNCLTSALVDDRGTVGWWPGPRFDGPSVFSSVLDPDAGQFSVAPRGGVRSARRAYLDGTLVLRTELRGDGGVLVVTDALALEPGARGHDIGHRSPQALVRVLEAVDGDVDAQVELVPRPEYGLTTPRVVRGDGVVHTAGGAERVTISGAHDLDVQRASVRGTLRLRAGQ